MRAQIIIWIGVILLLVATLSVVMLYRWGNDTGMRDFRANEPLLSIREADGATSEEIAEKLLSKWFDKFKTTEVGWAVRLRGYEVDRLDLKHSDDKMIVSATFSVMPTRWSFDNWMAGSGGTTSGPWIWGKFTRFAITKSEKGYHLKELGPGPL